MFVFTGIKGRYRCGIDLAVFELSPNFRNIHDNNFGLSCSPVTMSHMLVEKLSDLKGSLFLLLP